MKLISSLAVGAVAVAGLLPMAAKAQPVVVAGPVAVSVPAPVVRVGYYGPAYGYYGPRYVAPGYYGPRYGWHASYGYYGPRYGYGWHRPYRWVR